MIRIVLTAGERPEPLTYQFLTADGAAMDMTGSWVALTRRWTRRTGCGWTSPTGWVRGRRGW